MHAADTLIKERPLVHKNAEISHIGIFIKWLSLSMKWKAESFIYIHAKQNSSR